MIQSKKWNTVFKNGRSKICKIVFKKYEVIRSVLIDDVNLNFLKAVFHKLYHSYVFVTTLNIELPAT